MHTLARSENYAILADHDYVYLEHEGKRQHIGWMYGNAQAALFDFHERWVVIIGHGAWVIRLPLAEGLIADKAPSFNVRETLAGKAQAFADAPFVCLMEGATIFEQFFPEAVYYSDEISDGVRLVTGIWENEAGIYDLNLQTLELCKRAKIIVIEGEE